jgi:hypothetical protein
MTTFSFVQPKGRSLEIVVTGTGRSGTGYAAKWLSSIGIWCGHEAFFDYNGLKGALRRLRLRHERLIGDSAWQAAPHLSSQPLKDALIIHQVRHPKRVAESCMRQPPGTTPQYLNYLERHLPRSREYETDLDKAICRWIYWNRKIEEHLSGRDFFFWRIEEGTDALYQFLVDRGMVDATKYTPIMMFANKRYNHKIGKPQEARLEDIDPILLSNLVPQMQRYGYQRWE